LTATIMRDLGAKGAESFFTKAGRKMLSVKSKGEPMKIALSTLSSRQETILEALGRNENISISHQGKVVAVLRPPAADTVRERMLRTPAFGMWADRDDMADPNEWRRALRRKRRDRRPEGGIL